MISIGKICERNPSSSLLKGISLQPAWEFSRLFFSQFVFENKKAIARGNFGFFNFLAAVLALAFLGVLARAKDAPAGDFVQDGPQA